MPLVWSDDLNVGCDEIDSDHRELVGLAGALQTAIESGETPLELERRYAALAEFSARHFTLEEGLMLASGYPRYAEHRGEHQRLLEQLRFLRDSLVSMGPSDLLITIMTGWTVPHIRFADRHFASYLAQARRG